MATPDTEDDFSGVCPYLGLADDADSHATYATEAHRCYRLDNPTRIALTHQENFCLGESHTSCPVYKGEGIAAAAPAGARATAASTAEPAPAAPGPFARGGRAPRAPRDTATGGGTGSRSGPARKPPTGTIGPRPRPGGISMPVATIGLFALAIIVIVLAFVIQGALGSDSKGNGPLASVSDTQTAQAKSATPAQTQPPTTTTPGTTAPGTPRTGTPATGTPGTGTGTGAKEYTVVAGDSCGAIADKNGISLDQFFTFNPSIDKNCTNLQVGQVVKVAQ